MDRRALAVSTVVVLALAAGAVASRRSWWPNVGDGDGEGGSGRPPPALDEGSSGAAADDRGSPAALAAHPSPRAAEGLPPPVDLARADPDLDLHGTVVDATGAPVPGADLVTVTYPFDRASILAIDRDGEAALGPRTRSAKDGTFAIRLRRGAVVSLRVEAAGFAPLERPACHAGERVRIEMRPGVSLVVEATAPDGGPAAKVEFLLQRYGHSGTTAFRRVATTGADGRARFDDLPPDVSASLSIEASVWAWEEYDRGIRLPPSGQTTTRVVLIRGRTITGRVTDADTRAPIAGARVGMGWWVGCAVSTDADGRFALPGWIGRGIPDVHVLAQGYGRGRAVVGTASVVDVALSKGDSVVGRVVGPDRTPVGGAVVAAVGSARREGEQQEISTADGMSAPDGRFSLTGLRRDLPHTLVVMAEGYGRTLVDFDPRADGPGAVDLGDVVLPIGRTLLGRVLRADGTPLADAQLEVRGANADRGRLRPGGKPIEDAWYGNTDEVTTTADGRFSLLDLAPGTYGIDAWTPGMPTQHATANVGDDAGATSVEIRFPSGRPLVVSVVDDDGAPVPWAYLFVEDGGGPHNMVTSLDVQGRATLLVPDTLKSIRVETWGGQGDDPRRFLDAHQEFPVDPKASELRCVLKKGLSITGRVLGPDGAAVAQAGVQVWKDGDCVASDLTDGEGRFDVTVSREGPFTVQLDGSQGAWGAVRDAGWVGAVADVSAGAKDVVVRATPATRERTQEVRVVDGEGRPVEGAKVLAQWARTAGRSAEVATDATGRAVIAGLPGLSCSWRATPPAGAGDLLPDWTASAPSSSVVEIRLRRGIRVRGQVVLPADAADQTVSVRVVQAERMTRAQCKASDPVFAVLIDPENGEGGAVVAQIGPDDAPTHVARLEVARFGEQDLVLVPAPVK